MGDFKSLKVWQKAHGVAIAVHHLVAPIRDARFLPLRNQMIRSSESIPTNIVEGSRKASNKDFARFLDYSLNSACELEYQLMLARDIGASADATTSALINDLVEVRKMLHGFIRRLKAAKPPGAGRQARENES